MNGIVTKNLTTKRRDILAVLAQGIRKDGFAPSIREMCAGVGLHSSATLHHHLLCLEAGGYVTKRPNSPRAYAITESGWREVEGEGVDGCCCPTCGRPR